MNVDSIVDSLRNLLDQITHSEWLSTAVTIAIVVLVTLVVTKILSKMLRTMLNKGKGPLPSSSIFVNILRVTLWTVAVCIILSSCFNVNVGALLTALGVGGIAVSLGFQSTLSNLIGGLQVSLTGLVKPGDHIKVGTNDGVVRDVTWSHTSLINDDGEHIIIPNSVITSTAFTRRLPFTIVEIPLYITTVPEEGGLSRLAEDIETAANEALNERYKVKKAAEVSFSSTDDEGFVGTLEFHLTDSREADEATDVVIRVIAPFIHATDLVKSATDVKGTVKKTQAIESALAQQEREEREKKEAERKNREAQRHEYERQHRSLRHRLLGGRRARTKATASAGKPQSAPTDASASGADAAAPSSTASADTTAEQQ